MKQLRNSEILMPKKLIIANWKMLPTTLGEAQGILESINNHLELLAEQRNFSLVICPPFIYIEEVAKLMESSRLGQISSLGAQDIALGGDGGQTGEISGPMLAKLGVRYVIIGHSERRWGLGESDRTVNEKLKMALQSELVPIVCLGERERDGHYAETLKAQTEATFAGVSDMERSRCIIAYEPVWAISTNLDAQPDTTEGAMDAIAILREMLPDNTILYGGSVTAGNAAAFLSAQGIDGVLVGGASVRSEEFNKILTSAATL